MNVTNAAGGVPPYLWQPETEAEAWDMFTNLGSGAVFAAGATLLRTQWESGTVPMPAHLISLEGISSMQGLTRREGSLRIGSQAKLSDCRRQGACNLLAEACRTIAAPSIRQLATLGGNIASGIGDALPALLVKDALLYSYGAGGSECGELAAWLEARALGRTEPRLLTAVGLMPGNGRADESGTGGRTVEFYRKVGRREAFVPSLATAAFSALLAADGTLSRVRVAAGGGSSIAMRLRGAEALLEGGRADGETLRKFHAAVQAEWPAFTDAFASAAYRKLAAANLLSAGLWDLQRELGAAEREGCTDPGPERRTEHEAG
ncbi:MULTISPECIES: FAD binding domain-containing protein [Paenibacillus]|uniref:FAD binding domain-containing protein n=1 Tax=Paenibacillus TaxID=44249 RepID=UPI0022B9275E|nr:FAD binding domain-containing protein [Paenibacillus caseinilyticus]MCZ8522674.1 FAD binding domain-containing protein [Paenibacillus caseinilyticus]